MKIKIQVIKFNFSQSYAHDYNSGVPQREGIGLSEGQFCGQNSPRKPRTGQGALVCMWHAHLAPARREIKIQVIKFNFSQSYAHDYNSGVPQREGIGLSEGQFCGQNSPRKPRTGQGALACMWHAHPRFAR